MRRKVKERKYDQLPILRFKIPISQKDEHFPVFPNSKENMTQRSFSAN